MTNLGYMSEATVSVMNIKNVYETRLASIVCVS